MFTGYLITSMWMHNPIANGLRDVHETEIVDGFHARASFQMTFYV